MLSYCSSTFLAFVLVFLIDEGSLSSLSEKSKGEQPPWLNVNNTNSWLDKIKGDVITIFLSRFSSVLSLYLSVCQSLSHFSADVSPLNS